MTSTLKEPLRKSLLITLKLDKELLRSIEERQKKSAVMIRKNLEEDDGDKQDDGDEDVGDGDWATRMITVVKNEMSRSEKEHEKELAELRAQVAKLQQKNKTLASKVKKLEELEGSDDTIDKLATQLEWHIIDGDRAKENAVKLRQELDTVKQEKFQLEKDYDLAKQEVTRLSHETNTWAVVTETLQKENEVLKIAAAKKRTASEAFPSDD